MPRTPVPSQSFLTLSSVLHEWHVPSNSLTYIEILPPASSSSASGLLAFGFRLKSWPDSSLSGEGVGLGVMGNCPAELSGGKVNDGGGGDEFMVSRAHSWVGLLSSLGDLVRSALIFASRAGCKIRRKGRAARLSLTSKRTFPSFQLLGGSHQYHYNLPKVVVGFKYITVQHRNASSNKTTLLCPSVSTILCPMMCSQD